MDLEHARPSLGRILLEPSSVRQVGPRIQDCQCSLLHVVHSRAGWGDPDASSHPSPSVKATVNGAEPGGSSSQLPLHVPEEVKVQAAAATHPALCVLKNNPATVNVGRGGRGEP